MSGISSEDEMLNIANRRKSWMSFFLIWQCVAWVLLIWVAVGSSVVAAGLDTMRPPLVGVGSEKLIALSVAAASALLATLNPRQRAKAYRQAWVELDLAIKVAVGIPEKYASALQAGEKIIGEDGSQATNLFAAPTQR